MTPIHHEIYTFHITPSTPEARERIVDGAEKPGLLRGTLAQGRDLARLLNSPIDLLDAGHTAFHINPDGRMPCESDQDEAEIRSDLEMTTPLSAAARDQLDHLAGEVRHQLDAGHMPNGNDLDRLARWAQQAARHGVADADLEAKIVKQADRLREPALTKSGYDDEMFTNTSR